MTQLVAVTAGIGRGHSQYLNSVLSYLPDVPLVQVSGIGWQIARSLYRLGGRGGIWTTLYNRLRGEKKPNRFILRLLESPVLNRLKKEGKVVLADHPLICHILAPFCPVAYLHGEIAAPPVCAIPAARSIFVPLQETAEQLITCGVSPDVLRVTGLVIEPELLKDANADFQSRLQRIASNEPLNMGFFLSGASPKPHIHTILIAARSVLNSGLHPFIFCGVDYQTANWLKGKLNCPVYAFSSYSEETTATARILPQIDLFVAATHERTNWALGLGIPMFAILPHIGPFAPLNFEFAKNQGVCLPLEHPEKFGSYLLTLRAQGKLRQMAQNGWGKYPINGAQKIAELLRAGINRRQ
ncbi:hypothetical protein HPY86_06250 [candidate division WOR-3 bacterium]|jgi:hypothetical protein|nr:hypothetical protein [candidate division WOR-3 bacterium]